MNRLQFLAELKNSLIKTTKEITFPILEEKVEKLEDAADELVGVKWTKLDGISGQLFQGAREHYVNGKSLLLYSNKKEQLKAFEKVCNDCQTLSQWISYDKKLKCFSCEKTFEPENEIGDLTCKRYYIKEKDGEWFIGM